MKRPPRTLKLPNAKIVLLLPFESFLEYKLRFLFLSMILSGLYSETGCIQKLKQACLSEHLVGRLLWMRFGIVTSWIARCFHNFFYHKHMSGENFICKFSLLTCVWQNLHERGWSLWEILKRALATAKVTNWVDHSLHPQKVPRESVASTLWPVRSAAGAAIVEKYSISHLPITCPYLDWPCLA